MAVRAERIERRIPVHKATIEDRDFRLALWDHLTVHPDDALVARANQRHLMQLLKGIDRSSRVRPSTQHRYRATRAPTRGGSAPSGPEKSAPTRDAPPCSARTH